MLALYLEVLALLYYFVELLFVDFDLRSLHTLLEFRAFDLGAGALAELEALAEVAFEIVVDDLYL